MTTIMHVPPTRTIRGPIERIVVQHDDDHVLREVEVTFDAIRAGLHVALIAEEVLLWW